MDRKEKVRKTFKNKLLVCCLLCVIEGSRAVESRGDDWKGEKDRLPLIMVTSGCLLRTFASELLWMLNTVIPPIAWLVTTVFQCVQDTFLFNLSHWFPPYDSEMESLLWSEICLIFLWIWFFLCRRILFLSIDRVPLYLPIGMQCPCPINACLPSSIWSSYMSLFNERQRREGRQEMEGEEKIPPMPWVNFKSCKSDTE